MSKTILVTGATGNQGSAVLDALIRLDDEEFVILALTRNASTSRAKAMSAKSKAVHVLQGDMDNPESIFTEAQKVTQKPIWGVFMVQSVLAGGVTAAQEEAQGKKFIDTCIANKVQMLVYSSVDRGGDVQSSRDPTPVSVFASKHRIEQHLFNRASESSAMPWLVLRPTGLMEPFLRDDMVSKLTRTAWKIYVKPDRPLQYISCRDLAHFAVEGFRDPARWSRTCLSLAGWEGTFADANAVYRAVTPGGGADMPLTFGLLARFICGVVFRDLALSYEWYNKGGFAADIAHLRRLHPGLLGLEDCLRESNARAKN